MSTHHALLDWGLWVKAENVGICLFCSTTAFLSNELYLLSDRAPPAPWLSHRCLLGSATHQSVYKETSTLAYLPGITLSCSNLKSEEYFVLCSSCSLALSVFIAGLCIWNLKNARLRVQMRNSTFEQWAEVKYQLWYFTQRSIIFCFKPRKRKTKHFQAPQLP